ncbi:MAG: signal peptidase II [Clostridiales bacterium]|nr:signal peptidase II [Clostridiales bacterium]
MENKIKPLPSIFCGSICFVLLTLLDQITKKWAVLGLRGRDPVILIENVFELYYLENHGAAFGILQGQRNMFIVITVVILAVIVYMYARLPFTKKYRLIRVFLVLISAGAVGNFIDRVTQDYVVDFFYFVLIDFPVFNVADIYVTCSTVLLILVVLFKLREEDFTEILQSLGFQGKKKRDL